MLFFKHKWPLVMIILFAAAGVRAAETWPARFDAGEDGLEALIEFPETRGDGTIIIRCAAQVSDSGKMEKHGCYGDNSGADVFIAAINKAAKKARMQPAIIDGRPHAVYVQYRVRFETRGDENILTIYNNPGVLENIEAYGEDHIAAQRGLTKERWQRACPQQLRFLVWVKAHVAASGEQSSISIASNDGPPITQKCEAAIIATMKESGFTPALADGEPVPSTFVEPFGS